MQRCELKTAGSLLVPAIGAAEGIGGAGAAVLAVGEGAVVGAGIVGGGSGSAGIALATLVGPLGWAVVGSKKDDGENGYTWDCWKPIIRNMSTRPSQGMPLQSLAVHPNVQSVSLDQDGLLVGNIFGERFRLAPVDVEGTLAFHASIIS